MVGCKSSSSAGLLGTWALAALAFVLAFEYNDHVVAAGQSTVSGDPILQSHESTLHPPLPSPTTTKAPKCDRMFISNPTGPRNGTFTSPEFQNPNRHSHQCIYTFIAATNERVQVTFTKFNLSGTPPDGSTAGSHPECNHEYLDLYTEIEDPHTDLINTPFGGRYCGRIPPRKRISMFHILVISFYTDRLKVKDVFHGMYEFINSSRYQVGTPAPHTPCSFTINSEQKREGDFVSPTYPGVYPTNLVCSYKFLGIKDQRIRLEFLDFDLFYGGAHCPFDYIKVYDGPGEDSPLIGTHCGQQRNLVIYSSTEKLFVHFITLKRTAVSQNRGFSGIFEFSERYVNLGFIGKNDGEHIRGSECDQKILSKKESTGTVYSPNYPFPYHQNTICRYFIYGLQNKQYLERVRLEFERFDIPGTDSTCPDAYLKLYLRGQEILPDFDKHDYNLCGRMLPPVVVSEGPRLFMIFTSGNTQGQGFKARYIFETDYQVPGTPAPDGSCNFTYLSSSHLIGEFNSPRHPNRYPSNLSCVYTLRGRPGQQVKVVFENLQTKPFSLIQYGDSCQNDWVEVYNVYPDGWNRLIGRYCGTKIPGPTVSEQGTHSIRVLFHTDTDDVGSGFKARYTFQPPSSSLRDCGKNISGTENGIIMSPGYPDKYPTTGQLCNWFINVKPHHRVLLHFVDFAMDGDQTADSGTGCPTAVVRVWKNPNSAPIELCGAELPKATQQIPSETNVLRVSFVTADKAMGAKGFRASWTEIKEGPHCDSLHCKESGYCISQLLKCNKVPNCGVDDETDEEDCGVEIPGNDTPELDLYLLIGVVVGVTVLVVLGGCIWCHRKHKRRREEPLPHEPRLRHVCDAAGARFSSVDSV